MSKGESTTIQISKEARNELREFGKMGETYDDVVKKLIKIARSLKRNESS